MVTTALLLSALLAISGSAEQKPVPVKVVREAGAWQLLRGGKPYFIHGAGGELSLVAQVKSAGGNSMRTWGAEALPGKLDEAEKQGISVMAGIWLGHKEHGFDYGNPEQVKKQLDEARAVISKFKDHPAILAWGLGNEMEFDGPGGERVWMAVNDIAKMAKQIDPNHPTVTVVAEISKEKIANIKRYAPEIDILGVNSYGGLRSLPLRLREYGWDKPYVVTEFGPYGPWEGGKTGWGASIEPNSTEKAAFYLESYMSGVASAPEMCLGAYAFLWGDKQETTPTWFGMFLPTKEATPAVDVVSFLWTGKWPSRRAPEIRGFDVSAFAKEVAPGAKVVAEIRAATIDGRPVSYRWELRHEVTDTHWAGEGERVPAVLKSYVDGQKGAKVEFDAPTTPGAYRLYVYVLDGQGHASAANAPFAVKK